MFQYVTTNIKPIVRNDTMEGKDWLVCPTIMINEGVHNGSDGPIFYPADELGKLPVAWNHKPVVVYHPQRNGQMLSACDPIELTTRKVGVLMNTEMGETEHGPGLKSEAWLEPNRMEVVDNRIAEAIDNNAMMEVSTGLYMDLDKKEGTWNGEEYIGIARNIQPDHLALLPDVKGACSIEDGAGFLRTNQEEGEDEKYLIANPGIDVTDKYIRIRQKDPGSFKDGSMRTVWISKAKGIKSIQGKLKKPPKGHEGSMVLQSYLFVKKKWTSEKAAAWVKKHKGTTSSWQYMLNEMGHESIRRLLMSALREKDENAWIEEVYDNFFIYENEGKLYRQTYTSADGMVEITGQAEEVVKVTEYRRADGSFVGNAVWTTKYINDLPDSAFLYINQGGKKDGEGKTKPRSMRHFPFKDKNGKVDLPHLRNALARIPQSNVPAAAKKRATARAKSILAKMKSTSNKLFMKGLAMDKNQIVDVLIENEKTLWTEDNREELEALSEPMLTNMAELLKEKETTENKEEKATEKKEEKTETTATTTNEKVEAKTAEQYIAEAPEGIREMLQTGMNTLKQQKERLIKTIMANKKNSFTKEHLEMKDVQELTALAKLAATEEVTDNTIPLYIGQGEVPNVNQATPEVSSLPTMDSVTKTA